MLEIPKVITSNQNAVVRAASARVQIASCAPVSAARAADFFGSAISVGQLVPIAPSGNNPIASGERRMINSAGTTKKPNVIKPKTNQVWRQPSQRISEAATTGMHTLAKPTPMLEIASARPR